MINNQPNVPHGEGVKAKNKKRRTRACIYARDPLTRSPAETARPLLLAEQTNRATRCTFLSTHDSLDETLSKGSPRCGQLARVFRARTHTLHRKKDYNRAAGARRGEQKRQEAEDATRTQRHAPAFRCRRRIVPKRSLQTTGKEGKREESGRTKKSLTTRSCEGLEEGD